MNNQTIPVKTYTATLSITRQVTYSGTVPAAQTVDDLVEDLLATATGIYPGAVAFTVGDVTFGPTVQMAAADLPTAGVYANGRRVINRHTGQPLE